MKNALGDIPIVLLAGGRGTRLAEATHAIPKPMVKIGGKPILLHIMEGFAAYGGRDFTIALGYKGEVIKRFFLDYLQLNGSLAIDLSNGVVDSLSQSAACDWMIHLIDTGQATATGGRVRALRPGLEAHPTFVVTYGDGVSDVDMGALLDFHRHHGRVATLTAVRPPARFGAMTFDGPLVKQFTEKPQIGEGWINGGFLVLERGVFDYLDSSETSLEADALERLAADGELAAYRHEGFWQCMDTLRDVELLRAMWKSGEPPWRALGQPAPAVETITQRKRQAMGR